MLSLFLAQILENFDDPTKIKDEDDDHECDLELPVPAVATADLLRKSKTVPRFSCFSSAFFSVFAFLVLRKSA